MLSLSHNYFQVSSSRTKHEAPHTSTARYALGIVLLLVVDVLWVSSAEITKWVYTEKKYEKPFFTTYIRAAVLSIYLFALCISSPTQNLSSNVDYTQLLESVAETEDENFYSEASENLGDSTFVPVRATGENTDSDEAAPRAVRFNKVAEVRVMSAAQAGEALLARLSWQASRRAFEQAQRRAAASAARTHLRLAFGACVPWFMAHYLYRLSLVWSPTTSATLFVSSYSVFALATSVVFAQAPNERCSAGKAVAILTTTIGLVIAGAWGDQPRRLAAAVAAAGAGVCYTVHLVVLRTELRRRDTTAQPVFFGLVGGLSVLLVWPLGGALHAGAWEQLEWPTTSQWSWLFIDAACLVVAEPLFVWGRSLTSPLVATCCLALALPLSLCTEAYRGAAELELWISTVFVMAGWMCSAALAGGNSQLLDSICGWLKEKCWCGADRLSSLRYVSGIDEQSQSLISSTEEPT